MVYRARGYFGAKSKVYNTTMKRAVKETSLCSDSKDIQRRKSSCYYYSKSEAENVMYSF